MTESVIKTRGLRKSYGTTEVICGIDLDVHKGEVFAFLGPNGAGKTTIVEILEGYRKRSAGTVNVLGYDPASNDLELKKRIGIVLQTTGFDPYLTVEETFEVFNGYYENPKSVDELLEIVGLNPQRKTSVRKLSGGQQRRLDVGIGLSGNPELLFLDEPTTGFDPSSRREAWDMIKNLRSMNKTVLLTTHYIDEAEILADRVAIIVKGKIVKTDTPGNLTQRGNKTSIKFSMEKNHQELPDLLKSSTKLVNGQFQLRTDSPTKTLMLLTSWANETGIEIEELTVTRPSLEDVYLEIVDNIETEAVKKL